jgi:large conductance mechanosensitive channel
MPAICLSGETMKVIKEFKEFINKGNVVDLAVAVVIGGAFGKIVSALVSDMVMPLVNAVIPEGDWRKWEVTPLKFRVGDFMGTVVDFTIVAFVVFIIMVKIVGTVNKRTAAPETKQCPECLEMVPKAARRCRACTSVLTALALMLLAGTAAAQGNPVFTYGKPEEIKADAPPPPPVEWKALAKGGMSMTTGNSQTTNGTLALTVSRKANGNRFSFDAAMAYGTSNVLASQVTQVPDPNDPTMMVAVVSGIERRQVTSTNNWLSKARYDRFFTANNSGYASALAGADPVAGKSFAGGGQIGYSRQLVKNDVHLLVSEIGYDYSYERYVQQPMRAIDPVSIHSARLFVGETMKVSPTSGATASVEALFNLNREAKALNAGTGQPGVGAFKDTRVVGKVGLTTTVLARLSVGLGFTLRYDQNPPPRPIPSGTPAGIPYLAGFQPFSDKLDTLAEATLIYTFI